MFVFQMSVARFAFGPRLKAHRERKGITLQDIAESTKISISLLTGLERNDVSQWPKGIFRRAFLRSYARAIDIPFEPTWNEFVQLFPEDGAPPAFASEPTPLRLTLAPTKPNTTAPIKRHALAACIDLAVVVTAGLSVAWITGFGTGTVIAILSVGYAAVSTTAFGGSLALWHLRKSSRARRILNIDHEVVIDRTSEAAETRPALTLEPDRPPTIAPQPVARPRIVAVTSAHSSSDARERRVADR